jgi:hypothetical protein
LKNIRKLHSSQIRELFVSLCPFPFILLHK